jgi:uncharacterized protein YegL
MKKTLDITVVLDRSGSMQALTNETINGFNEFINSQKKLDTEVKVTLIQFDHEYIINYEAVNINRVPALNMMTYVPRGGTALLDAIGKTIKMTKNRHKLMGETDAPDKTMIVIITDGYENSSTKYTAEIIFKKIKKMEEKRGWEFIYLGANQDAIRVAGNYGIESKRAMSYAFDKTGTSDMFRAVSNSIHFSMMNNKDFAFTEKQRMKQKRDN